MKTVAFAALLAWTLVACAPEAKESACAGMETGKLYACLKAEGLLEGIQAPMVGDPDFLDALVTRMEASGKFKGSEGTKGEKGETGQACFDAPGVTDVNGSGGLDVGDCVGPKGDKGEQGLQGKAPTSTEVANELIDNDGIRQKMLAAMAQSGQFKGEAGTNGVDGKPGESPKPLDVATSLINNLELRQALLAAMDDSALFGGDPGPKGDKGDPGDKGEQGEQGPPGESPSAAAVATALLGDPVAVAALTGPAGANCWEATGDANGDGTADAADCLVTPPGVATEDFVTGVGTDILRTALCAPQVGTVTGFAPVTLTEGSGIAGDDACVAAGWSTCTRTYQLLNDGSAIATGCLAAPGGWGPDAFVCCEL
ncbi:MAG: hypothetical protein AMXMBFR64_46400 [Myxococcales bacterium]